MDRQSEIERLRGCFLAVPTLYHDDLSLNLDGMRQHVHFLIEHGLRQGTAVFLVNGASGEFPTLTLEERKRTAEAVVEAVKETIAKASPGGGHILASSNSIHPAVDPTNYRTMVEAAHRFGTYPLDEQMVAEYAGKSYIAAWGS